MNDSKGKGVLVGALIGAAAGGIAWVGSKLIRYFSKYDEDGYDINGFDRRGFDRNGFDAEGFDNRGRDAEGYDRNGFGTDGFDREGYDRYGYDRTGYNNDGVDRAGCSRQKYQDRLTRLSGRLNEAHEQLRKENYRYALQDSRLVMEETLKLILYHTRGILKTNDILGLLKECERYHILEEEMINKLHEVRRLCNENGHEFDAEEWRTHDQVHFVVMQTRELLNTAMQLLTI